MLVDSSVWIDFLRGTSTAETRLLLRSLERGGPVWTAPPILQEVLQGAESQQRFEKWDRTLGEMAMLTDPDVRSLVRTAAQLYARCRWHGVTPRSANDCLIAQYAVRGDMPLLHSDRDFISIARLEPRLKLLEPARLL